MPPGVAIKPSPAITSVVTCKAEDQEKERIHEPTMPQDKLFSQDYVTDS